MFPYFKMYFEYCNKFQDSREIYQKMNESNHRFVLWIKSLEFTKELNNLDWNSQIIKPVQRLPKYVLLFKDLKKNTDVSHPDYKNIELCLKKFEEINHENNAKMNNCLRILRLEELDKKFSNQLKINLLDISREFLEEESLSIL
jgi:hypothetical protein